MPEKPCVTKDFLRDVFSEKKQLFKKSEMKYITVPAYDELSVRRLWPQLKKDAEFAKYFLDKQRVRLGGPVALGFAGETYTFRTTFMVLGILPVFILVAVAPVLGWFRQGQPAEKSGG